MKEIECKEVIISRLATRGKGIIGDPIRRIVQVFEKDGTLIAEWDHHEKDKCSIEYFGEMPEKTNHYNTETK